MIESVKSLDQAIPINPAEREELQKLLLSYSDRFALNPLKPTTTSVVMHQIDTGNNPPIRVPPYPLARSLEPDAKRQIDEMLVNKIIEPTNDSAWGFPIVLAMKKDGSRRFCVDYRKLNAITKTSSYPIPLISELLDCFNGAKYFSSLDLASGYWQIKMHPDSREKTAFVSKWGTFIFNVMPFGLLKAPATFQSLMDRIFGDIQWKHVCVYFDDIFIFSKTFDEHIRHLREVLDRLRNYQLQAKLTKCQFSRKEIIFLGHLISADGIRPDPDKIKVVKEWPKLKSTHDVRSFIGLCSYYRKFIPQFATIAAPLHQLQSKTVSFEWSEQAQQSFERLQSALISAPVLINPDWNLPFELHTDASKTGLGAVLSQRINGEERVVAFASKSLNKAQKNYTTSDQECLAIVWGIRNFRTYLLGRPFKLYTDHSALQFLKTMRLNRDLSGRLARYQMFLQEYEFEPYYRKGESNANADALSRMPVITDDIDNVGNDYQVTSAVDVINVNHAEFLAELPTTNELYQLQRDDDEFKLLIDCLENDTTVESIVQLTPAKRLILQDDLQSKKYSLDTNGILVYSRRFNLETHRCIVIPMKLRPLVLHHMHSDILSAHLGVHKTYERILYRFYWKGVFKDTQNFVMSCPKCIARKDPKKRPRLPLLAHVPVGNPFSEIAFDAVGPFPRTASGNIHIVVLACRLTKYCELFAVPDLKEERIAHLIIEEIVPRHGCPRTILSDRAASFNSELLQQVYTILNAKKIITSAYNPQHNGQVERFNHTLVTMLSMYCNQFQNDWDQHLNLVKGAYHSAPNSTTGYTPNYLLYGRELKLPIDEIISAKELYQDRDDYLSTILTRTSFAQDLARARMLNRRVELEEKHDPLQFQINYSFGDQVFVFVPDTKTKSVLSPDGNYRDIQLSNKLRSRWQGPFNIVERTSVVNYRVMRRIPNTDDIETRMVNVRRMKPFTQPNSLSSFGHQLDNDQHRSIISSPTVEGEVVQPLGEEEFEVEEILAQRRYRNKIQYLVKWLGWGSDHNTWEPLDNLVNCAAHVAEFNRKQQSNQRQ